MQILALKLILTPLLTGLATWAGRRYGHAVSGLLIGLPLNAGPIALFLALEHGNKFASASSKGIILGAVSLGLFSTVYAALSRKFHWALCVFGGWAAYLEATLLLNLLQLSLTSAFLLTMLGLAILFISFPKFQNLKLDIIPPKWDIPLRIVLATLFIIGLTFISGHLGPNLSGLLSTFPIFGTIFATTTHYLYGVDACIRLLKGVIVSLFSLAIFFLVIAAYIQHLGIGLTFLLATAICLMSSALIHYIKHKIKLA